MRSGQNCTYYGIDGSPLTAKQREEAVNGENTAYYFENPILELGGSERLGLRDTQEDRFDYAELAGFSLLNQARQNHVIQATINEIEEKLHRAKCGSCLLTCIVVPLVDQDSYELVTINLGDSEALLAQAENDEVKIHRLNNLHNPSQRLGGTLAVDHALGDERYEVYGLSHQAEITRDVVKKSNQETFLFLVCDGVTEVTDDISKFTRAIRSFRSQPAFMANSIVREALLEGSQDNLSAFVIPLTNRRQPIHSPIALSIYDGHGGSEVASLAQRLFLDTLAKNILQELKKDILHMNEQLHDALHKQDKTKNQKLALLQSAKKFALALPDEIKNVEPKRHYFFRKRKQIDDTYKTLNNNIAELSRVVDQLGPAVIEPDLIPIRKVST